ncbi:uncharacterized protein A1O9_05804 [Exophiala aquamarina CBS 119918]|uniref:CENP-V/GFA domain-containing protein n=1 Tax=Exophiala aquamarina CBS 119918 TaxID=1182545 RepID=A0A072PF53_9EURO|nr:uncharacterized protein A1O9_05804 [Exophiala aquamarina CBS 119918]KEF57883.1 hypothetical protein A1O9_05804 [Exophiala aquamarina CBS 119918]
MPPKAHQQRFPLSTAQLTCLCGDIKEPGTLLRPSSPTKTFPVGSHMCHCNSCRYTTGNITLSCPVLVGPPSTESLARCTTYSSSASLFRYFCSRCGCHCFHQEFNKESQASNPRSSSNGGAEEPQVGKWYVNAGLIERDPAQVAPQEVWATDLVETEYHHHIADTVDGSIVPGLADLDGAEIPLYLGPSSQVQGQQASVDEIRRLAEHRRDTKPNPDCLKAACQCGGIAFSIRRPNYAMDDQGVPARHIGHDKTKYPALFCAFRYDRASSGAWFVQPWTYVPPANITFTDADEDDDQQSRSAASVTLLEILAATAHEPPSSRAAANVSSQLPMTWYRSSRDITRSFCRVCGATVFYLNDGRPSLANISVGILRGDEGALARRWLEWTWGRVVCPESATERVMLEALMGLGDHMRVL